MGLHLRDPLFARLVRDPRLVAPAQQILGDDDLYIQQVKVNAKEAFTGEQWQWHYDFATHHREDGVPEPLALNLHIFLDEVTEFNGPLIFIPGSHRDGPAPTALDTATTSYPLWTVAPEVVQTPRRARRAVLPEGPAGHDADLRRLHGAQLATEHVAMGSADLLTDPQSGQQPPDHLRPARSPTSPRFRSGATARGDYEHSQVMNTRPVVPTVFLTM